MVIDTSAILGLFFGERHAEWVADALSKSTSPLEMSTVNLAEVLILLRDRQPRLWEDLESKILASGIRFVAPRVEDAQVAAEARLRYPLNLGDCFAYALAKRRSYSLLTLDHDFRATDIDVIFPD